MASSKCCFVQDMVKRTDEIVRRRMGKGDEAAARTTVDLEFRGRMVTALTEAARLVIPTICARPAQL